MDLADAFYLFLLGVAAWVFLPRRWRRAVVAARDTWWETARPRLWETLVIAEAAAYRAVVGPARVNSSDEVMSRTSDDASPEPRAAVRQTGQTDAPPKVIPVPTPDQMVDIFRQLRAAGVKRDDLRPLWNAAGLPLDNNLWTKAAPAPEAPPAQTPIGETPYDPARYRSEAPVVK